MTEQPAIITRPTQAEVNYKSHADERQCQHCRWFAKASDGGPYCHLVQTAPADISADGSCDRHETLTPDTLMDMGKEAPASLTDTAEVPVFVDEAVIVALDGSVSVPVDVDSTSTLTHEWTMNVTVPDTVTTQTIPDGTTVVIDAFEPDTVHVQHTATDDSGKSITSYIKAKVADLFKRGDEPLTGLKVVGNHWFITWSNNFEDREGEIFTAKAIDDYVARVDAGFTPPPTLRVWHIGKSTDIGQAEMVGRHGHFLIAAGTFYDGKAAQNAKVYYAKNARKTAVSHGFTFSPKHFDGRHYHQFNTFEISVLPRGKEANSYTSLDKVKEMPLTDEKKTYLTEIFQDEVPDILAKLDENGKALEEANVAFKEFAVLDDSAVNVETEAAKEAVEVANKDFKTLVVDLIGDVNTVLTMNAQAMKSMAAYKQSTDATIAKQNETITALKQQLDDRPRSASKDEATELTTARLQTMNDEMDKQSKTLDPFWKTEVNSLT